jgi:GH25 family lysozyme M1 (1,4-beta-N-acetylmuramidase)
MENARMKRKKKQQRISLISNIIFCLITLAALTGCIFLLLKNYTLKNQSEEAMAQLQAFEEQTEDYIYTQSDLDAYIEEARTAGGEEQKSELLNELKAKMSNGGTTSAMLRDFFPEDVVVYADGEYHFFPIEEKLQKHSYVYDNFRQLENGQIEYVDDTDEVISQKGIDVSKYQGDINWQKVAAEGIEYAFIRAGVRGSTEGKIMKDENFKDNIEGALDNDIEVGVYFFTQALTEEEAEEEADFVIDMLEAYDVTYPVVLDLEEVTSANARTQDLTQEEYTRNCIAFCKKIKAAGYTPMIYGNLKTFLIMLDMDQLEEYDKWFAYYNTPVYFPYEFAIWQYSSKGSVNGIKGDVDLNICMKNFSQKEE